MITRLKDFEGARCTLRNNLPEPMVEATRKKIASVGFHVTTKRDFERYTATGKFDGHFTLGTAMSVVSSDSKTEFLQAMLLDIDMMVQTGRKIITDALLHPLEDGNLPVVIAVHRLFLEMRVRKENIVGVREITTKEIEKLVKKAKKNLDESDPTWRTTFHWRIRESTTKLIREISIELSEKAL